MNYQVFCVNPVQENCYIVWDEVSGEAAIIDCGAWTSSEKAAISLFVSDKHLKLKYALQTHTHFDHVVGLPFVSETYAIHPYCHRDDATTYASVPEMLWQWFHIKPDSPLPQMSYYDQCGTLSIGTHQIHVIHTPGHSPGSVCLHIPSLKLLFSGDTLFNMSIGRTDLPGGSYQQEIESIHDKLLTLDETTTVLPGHGLKTTIAKEKLTNPYLI